MLPLAGPPLLLGRTLVLLVGVIPASWGLRGGSGPESASPELSQAAFSQHSQEQAGALPLGRVI